MEKKNKKVRKLISQWLVLGLSRVFHFPQSDQKFKSPCSHSAYLVETHVRFKELYLEEMRWRFDTESVVSFVFP